MCSIFKIKTMSIKFNSIYGFIIGLALIVYFLFMRMFNLETFVELRFLNLAIVLGGMYWMYYNLFKKQPGVHTYFEGIASGVQAVLIATLTLVVFLQAFMYFNPDFIQSINDRGLWGQDMTVITMGFVIGFEGFFSGFLLSYLMMQFFKPYTKSAMYHS